MESPMTSSMNTIYIIQIMALLRFSKVSCPPIPEKSVNYICTYGKQTFDIIYGPKDFNISTCEQIWNFGEKPIADLHDSQCIPPCVQVFNGEIHLTQCINVTLILFCGVHGDAIEEVRVHFVGSSSNSQGHSDQKKIVLGVTSLQGQQNYHIGLLISLGIIILMVLIVFIKNRT